MVGLQPLVSNTIINKYCKIYSKCYCLNIAKKKWNHKHYTIEIYSFKYYIREKNNERVHPTKNCTLVYIILELFRDKTMNDRLIYNVQPFMQWWFNLFEIKRLVDKFGPTNRDAQSFPAK